MDLGPYHAQEARHIRSKENRPGKMELAPVTGSWIFFSQDELAEKDPVTNEAGSSSRRLLQATFPPGYGRAREMNGILKGHVQRIYSAGGRFLLYWAGTFGFFVTSANCPCCGQPGCPAGAAGMGVLAGVIAGAASFLRRGLRRQTEKPIACDDGAKTPEAQTLNP